MCGVILLDIRTHVRLYYLHGTNWRENLIFYSAIPKRAWLPANHARNHAGHWYEVSKHNSPMAAYLQESGRCGLGRWASQDVADCEAHRRMTWLLH